MIAVEDHLTFLSHSALLSGVAYLAPLNETDIGI